ncbi:J domain-containing protein [Candidatus Nitrosacidococcus sp. I8]|uniref:J domain-containing protein n=1 Tax=Candidatus Nitrosacidococcus sp. I8 TaxID=2942908 RepID=UPI0022267AA2|nr:J domain-containing protein [Candidatus Nitrosacidococcus sp. I8]CAH9018321.1 hypothetical protein NURINAE_00859 [Candidatus Nitrosacidococcus sp. I8]
MPKKRHTIADLLLAVYQNPLQYQDQLKKGSLPEPFIDVLRLGANKEIQLDSRKTVSLETIQKAALFYIEQACLNQDQDLYRILGFNGSASVSDLQKHYHLLMLVYHPDRAKERTIWGEKYATRINNAYHQLKNKQKSDQKLHNKSAKKEAYLYKSIVNKEKENRVLLYLIQKFPIGIRYLPHIILWGSIGLTFTLISFAWYEKKARESNPVSFQQENKVLLKKDLFREKLIEFEEKERKNLMELESPLIKSLNSENSLDKNEKNK